jgi:hypothetical protein
MVVIVILVGMVAMRMVMVVPVMIMVMMNTIMRRMILSRMTVCFSASVRVAVTGIRAALGIKRRFDLNQPSPQPRHHRFDHVIAPDAQTLRHDLGRQVTVPEMPGDANQMLRVRAADFHQRLRCRDNFDQPAIFEHQRVTAAQRDRVFQIEEKFKPARARHHDAPPVPVVEIEHNGVSWRLAPAMLSPDLRRADHDSQFRSFGLKFLFMTSIT